MKWLAIPIALLALVAIAYFAFRSKEPHLTLVSTYTGLPEDHKGGKTLLVAIKAKWASVWRVTGEVLANVDPNKYDITIIDVDSEPERARGYAVTIVPTVVVYRDGKEVSRLPNLMSADQLP